MIPAERAKAIQTDSDATVRALSKHLQVDEHNLGCYLNGKHTMPYDVLVRFADYYHVTTDYLLGRTDTKEEPFPVSPAERTMLTDFRTLNREQRELIACIIKKMLEQNMKK